jgi:hypothetical protein
VRDLSRRFDDLIPADALRVGFLFDGQQVSFGSFLTGLQGFHGAANPAAAPYS